MSLLFCSGVFVFFFSRIVSGDWLFLVLFVFSCFLFVYGVLVFSLLFSRDLFLVRLFSRDCYVSCHSLFSRGLLFRMIFCSDVLGFSCFLVFVHLA